MKNKRTSGSIWVGILLVGLLVSMGNQALYSRDQQTTPKRPPLSLDYIANEGVVISIGDDRILIDALFDKPHANYRAPAAETLNKIIKGQAPFEKISLILFTHKHADHFDADLTARVMENHSEALLIIPRDMVHDLQKASKNWKKIKSRVKSLDLEIGESEKITIGRISLRACRTKHSGDRESPHNLMYVVGLEGWRIFHEGDSDGKFETFQKFGLGGERLDLALVHFWFPLNRDGAKILQELLVPDHIALIHLPIRLEEDAPSKIAQVKKYYKDIFLLLPDSKRRTFK